MYILNFIEKFVFIVLGTSAYTVVLSMDFILHCKTGMCLYWLIDLFCNSWEPIRWSECVT